MNGHDGVVKILLKHNATVSKVDSDTRNVLDTAIHYGQTSVKVSLIKHIAVNGFCVYGGVIHYNEITNFIKLSLQICILQRSSSLYFSCYLSGDQLIVLLVYLCFN